MENKKHLFLFTIGPVQSFISQARKTQDLYTGSRILSELIKAAIDVVGGRDKVIFPFAYPADDAKWAAVESLPNRFIAEVDLPESELAELGRKTKAAVLRKWKGYSAQAISKEFMLKVASTERLTLDCQGINQQVDNHLDIHWIFEPYTEGVESYRKAFAEIETKLGAIKNVRVFEQFSYNGIGEQGRKCSLDGQRNIKFYRKNEGQRLTEDAIIQEKYLFAKAGQSLILDYDNFNLVEIKHLQPGEGLSAVSFIKRRVEFNGKNNDFESTADIALLNTIAFWKTKHKAALDAYKAQFGSNFNAQLFYEDNLNEKYFEKQGLSKELKIPNLKNQLSELESLAKKGDLKLSRYYAVIAFDGDSMGKWLGGEYLSEGQSLKAFHQKFAYQLSIFAREAKAHLDDKNRGRTIYAGGDDFLGLININHLFDVLSELQQLFKKYVSDALLEFRKNEKVISFSAGICVAHYKEPLSIALSKAKMMEEHAKEHFKNTKNAFGISVLSGSGQEQNSFWQFSDATIEGFKNLTLALRDDKVSNTFIKSFDSEFSLLIENRDLSEKGELPFDFNPMLEVEIDRMILRGVKNDYKTEVTTLAKQIWAIYDTTSQKLQKPDLRNFISMLHISNFIQRHLSK